MKTNENSQFRVPTTPPPDAADVPEIETEPVGKIVITDPPTPAVEQLAKTIGWDAVRKLAE